MTAIVGAVTVFAVGSAVDYTNFLTAQRVVRSAIDSASIAAAIELDEGGSFSGSNGAEEQAQQIFAINVQDSALIDVSAVTGSLRVVQAPGTREVVATADLVVPTYFAGIFGFDQLSTTVSSTAGFEEEITEFVFVLDNTGSMSRSINGSANNNERISALRTAMLDTIDLVLPASGVNDDLVRVGIVPYATSVNLGSFYEAAVSPFSDSFRDSIHTCVTEREGSNQREDVQPILNVQSQQTFNQQSVRETYYETDVRIRTTDVTQFLNNDGDLVDTSEDSCPDTAVRPLTNDRQALIDDINSFNPSGFTSGHIGVEWGLNLLSENWQGFWSSVDADSSPADYNTPNVRKVLVVMTDGEFNTQYLDNPARNPSQGRIQSEAATRAFCDLGKSAQRGIEIYAISLGRQVEANNPDTPANILLQDCASDDAPGDLVSHFQTAGSLNDLRNAFTSIVEQSVSPRLTQ
ncbi:MAG: hypothetical protein ABJL18_09940 [Hyphomicrobiales bacterium]